MITGIHISQEIFVINMLTALKLSLEHDRKHTEQLLRQYGDSNQNKVVRKNKPCLLCLFAYSYRQFKKLNRASLNCSLEVRCLPGGGGYTHAALETV